MPPGRCNYGSIAILACATRSQTDLKSKPNMLSSTMARVQISSFVDVEADPRAVLRGTVLIITFNTPTGLPPEAAALPLEGTKP